MKLLCTGDWHLHNFTDFSKSLMVSWNDSTLRYTVVSDDSLKTDSKEMNSRLFNILNGICDMRDYCLTHGITDMLMSGDLFHKRANIEVSVFNPAYKVLSSFRDLGINLHAISGNHDDVDSSQIPMTSIHSFREIIHVIEKPEYFSIDGVEVVAVPYSKDKQFVLQSIEELREKCSDPDRAILLCHVGLTGGKVGSGMYVMSDEYSLGDLQYDHWKYVICGHYHQPQILEYNSIYCGTPVQNNFGDELKGKDGYNGFFVIDTERRWDIEFIPIIAPRFITFSSVEELEQADADFIKSNYVRVKSTASQADEIQDRLEDMLGDNTQDIRLELEKDYSVDQRSEVSVTQSFEDTVRTYAQEKWENKETLNSVIAQGLDILNEAMTGGK